MRTIEIFANENGNIAVNEEGKLFELNPIEYISDHKMPVAVHDDDNNQWIINSEKYEIINKDIGIAVPVGGGESWTVEILLNKKGNYVLYVDLADEFMLVEKVPVSAEYLKEHKFESKGVAKIS